MRVWLVLLTLVPALVGAQTQNEETAAKSHFREGAKRFGTGDWNGAIAEYQEAYRILPLPEFIFNIGRAYESAHRLEDAKQSYLSFLRREPDGRGTKEAYKRLSDILAGEHGITRRLMPRSKLATIPLNVRTVAEQHFREGTKALTRQIYPTAMEEYEQAFAAVPLTDFLFNLARVYDASHQTARAEEMYLEYLANEPNGAGSAIARTRVVEMLLERTAVVATAIVEAPEIRRAAPASKNKKLWLIVGPVIAAVAVGVGVGVGVGVWQASRDPFRDLKIDYPFTVKLGM